MLRIVAVVFVLGFFWQWTDSARSQALTQGTPPAAGREAAELAAFQATVRATEFANQQLWATYANIGITAVGTVMTAVAAWAAAVAARSASRAIHLERAWIGAPTIELVPGGRGAFAIRATVKNVGKTEVSALYIRAQFCNDDVPKELSRIIDESKKAVSLDNYNFEKHSIVPGSKFRIESNITNEAFQPIFRASDWNPTENLPYPHLVGCTLYKSGNGGSIRQTPFICSFRFDTKGQLAIDNVWTMDVT